MIEGNAMNVGALILAAGSSSRMGRPKQTLQFEGMSLLKRATLAALDAMCCPVVVVTGAHAELSRRELDQLGVREAFNPDWETGMGSSVRVGVERLLSLDADVSAAVLLLCDQPYVTSDVVSTLLAVHRTTGRRIIASAYGGSFGVPALFSRTLFTELTQLAGWSGAKEIIKRHASETHFLPFPQGEVDVDTPDDFSCLIAAESGGCRRDGNKYERGKRILETLTGQKEVGPKRGFAAFSPEIDRFLKEHLFADILQPQSHLVCRAAGSPSNPVLVRRGTLIRSVRL